VLARAKDGDVVAELHDLIDKMSDEQDGDAFHPQALDKVEHSNHFVARKGRCRLIQDE
jgi:hypothetical protein